MTVLNRIKEFLDNRPDPVSGTEYTSPYRFWQDTGIGRDTAYRMYNDSNYIPTSKALNKICSAYQIQPGAFLLWEPDDIFQPAAEQENFEELQQRQKLDVDSDPTTSKRTRSFLSIIPKVQESA